MDFNSILKATWKAIRKGYVSDRAVGIPDSDRAYAFHSADFDQASPFGAIISHFNAGVSFRY
jgi:hypothetical protein